MFLDFIFFCVITKKQKVHIIWVSNQCKKILHTVLDLFNFFDNVHDDYRLIIGADDKAQYSSKFGLFRQVRTL